MAETIEERLEDLEQLVLRQAERIAALEERLEIAHRLIVTRAMRELRRSEDEAA